MDTEVSSDVVAEHELWSFNHDQCDLASSAVFWLRFSVSAVTSFSIVGLLTTFPVCLHFHFHTERFR